MDDKLRFKGEESHYVWKVVRMKAYRSKSLHEDLF